MSTVTDVLVSSVPKTKVISRRALVYKTSRDNITVIIVPYGDIRENTALIQFIVPRWDHPYNGKIIKHYISAYPGTKNVDFVNDKFASHHVSLYNNEGFWKFQLNVCLPFIGERLAIYDSDTSKVVDTHQFLQCYREGIRFKLNGQTKIFSKKLPKS